MFVVYRVVLRIPREDDSCMIIYLPTFSIGSFEVFWNRMVEGNILLPVGLSVVVVLYWGISKSVKYF